MSFAELMLQMLQEDRDSFALIFQRVKELVQVDCETEASYETASKEIQLALARGESHVKLDGSNNKLWFFCPHVYHPDHVPDMFSIRIVSDDPRVVEYSYPSICRKCYQEAKPAFLARHFKSMTGAEVEKNVLTWCTSVDCKHPQLSSDVDVHDCLPGWWCDMLDDGAIAEISLF